MHGYSCLTPCTMLGYGNLAEEMANGGRNLENGIDHYFIDPSLDIHPCAGSPCTGFIGAIRYLVVECPSLTDLRHRYLYRCRGRDNGVYYISKVLGPECLAQGHDVFRFMEEAGLLPKL
ncbi:hypothetical protein E2C01_061881 [Portunus trituberculatus]|uniref:Uncharacterized protein n=1 Tax=Portunus trituberculatus TaxID=210409 RepID=A0A5B7H522_PORTR|nr:hypothetical protein [Portunus trituberculatus]